MESLIWIICDMIIYGFETIIIGVMMVGLIGFMEGGKYKNPKLQKVFDAIFSIEDEA